MEVLVKIFNPLFYLLQSNLTKNFLLLQSDRKFNIEGFIDNISFTYLLFSLYVILGLLLLLYGRRIFHVFLSLAGLVSGYAIANQLNMHFMHMNNEISLVFYFVMAIAFAILFGLAYKFSFFLAGTSIAIYCSIFLFRLYMPNQNPPWIYVLSIAVICGTIAAIYRDHFVSLATATSGSLLIADTIYSLSFNLPPAGILRGNFNSLNHIANRIVLLILLITLTTLGFLYQIKSKKKKRKKRF